MATKTRTSKVKSAAPVVSTSADPCQVCEGEGTVAAPITRRRDVPGQSAICLACLGSGLA